jgi:hypothetical protein
MQVFTITAKIPKPVEEVFKYITTPENFPRWKKDVWIAGKKYGNIGKGAKMIQTVYLMSPRQFMMHVTGFTENSYFRFESFKGFAVLTGWSYYFQQCEQGTLLTVVSEMNIVGAVYGILYPLGLYWHWKTWLQLLSRELTSKPNSIRLVSFANIDELKSQAG